jgi:hypothetical protein
MLGIPHGAGVRDQKRGYRPQPRDDFTGIVEPAQMRVAGGGKAKVGDSTDRFDYNQSIGDLYHSANGSVASGTLIAQLGSNLTAANLFFLK